MMPYLHRKAVKIFLEFSCQVGFLHEMAHTYLQLPSPLILMLYNHSTSLVKTIVNKRALEIPTTGLEDIPRAS